MKINRSGAAQGLSETLAVLGVDKLNSLMDQVVETAQDEQIAPHVRDGYIMLFVYLPATFKQDFIPHISSAIMPIIKVVLVTLFFMIHYTLWNHIKMYDSGVVYSIVFVFCFHLIFYKHF